MPVSVQSDILSVAITTTQSTADAVRVFVTGPAEGVAEAGLTLEPP